MVKQSASTKSSTHRATETIRDMIFRGELEAGSDHLESELAERLGMSRTPVREATLMLEGQGLLRIRPRKGVRIAAQSAQDMDEIYEILTELECVSVQRAARMRPSSTELAALEATLQEMDAALTASDLYAWAEADERFHTELVRLGGNAKILSIVRSVNDQVRNARLSTLHLRPAPTKSAEDHRQVYRAIEDGDAVLAEQVHRAHRDAARKMLVGLLWGQEPATG